MAEISKISFNGVEHTIADTSARAEIAALEQNIEPLVDTAVENEKGNIVDLLIAELQGLPVFGVVDENNTIKVTSQLSDGVYALKYENADGTYSDVGIITIGNGDIVSYTNLADPTSDSWKNGYRINSSFQYVVADGFLTTNWFPCKTGSVIRVKGLAMARQDYNEGGIEVGGYSGFGISADGVTPIYAHKMSDSTVVSLLKRDADGIETLDLTNFTSSAGTFNYVCLTGRIENTVEDIIITVDEEIV